MDDRERVLEYARHFLPALEARLGKPRSTGAPIITDKDLLLEIEDHDVMQVLNACGRWYQFISTPDREAPSDTRLASSLSKGSEMLGRIDRVMSELQKRVPGDGDLA